MVELVFGALFLGIMLSLVFIGPIFFLLIETSFSRGPRHALALDVGVISADLLCIVAAYFASSELLEIIDQHPGFYRITALLILVYGIVMIITKAKMHLPGEEKIISQNYLKTFINGFLFNILNVGVVLFWLVTVVSVRNSYPETSYFIFYISIVLATYLGIDLFKIFLAKQFHDRLTQALANKIRKIVGYILIAFSILVFLQSFETFNQLKNQMKEAEHKQIKK